MAYSNELSGVLFRNEKKEPESKQPDYNGSCEIEGKAYEIAGWKRQSKNGNPFLSLKFQVPREKAAPKPAVTSSFNDVDDDLPF